MTYKECIEFFRKCSNDSERFTQDERTAFLQGIAAIEKQKAKVPEYEGDGYDKDGNLIYDKAYCPYCRREFELDYDESDFCPMCGQALDWSDIQ